MPDYAFPPPQPPPTPYPDQGLLPGPGFTGDRNPLPSGPMTWPAVPFPGTPALTPFQEAGGALGYPWPLQAPPGVTPRPSPGTDAGQAVYRDAYSDLLLGGPGTHPGAHPGLPASTVGGMTPRWVLEAGMQEAGIGTVPDLLPAAQAKKFGADVVASQELGRLGQNVGIGVLNAAGPLGSAMFPGLWPQMPTGYPTTPSGAPMPYDPSLPVGGGNVSPGMPGSPPNQYPTPPPPTTYQRPIPTGPLGFEYPLNPGVQRPQEGRTYER
jgi:hypothetical protein